MIPEIIGIIGNVHGVSASKSPKPKNVRSTRVRLPCFIVSAIESLSDNSFSSTLGSLLISFKTSLIALLPILELSISNLNALFSGS